MKRAAKSRRVRMESSLIPLVPVQRVSTCEFGAPVLEVPTG